MLVGFVADDVKRVCSVARFGGRLLHKYLRVELAKSCQGYTNTQRVVMLDVVLGIPGGLRKCLCKPNPLILRCLVFQVVALGYCQTTVNAEALFNAALANVFYPGPYPFPSAGSDVSAPPVVSPDALE
jgi:hypothetical protein